jgi:tRNA(Arg) A34 adenosine deaminase TadA
MRNQDRIFKSLFDLTTQVIPVAGAKISAFITDKNNNIISAGFNSKKTHPFQAKFGKNEFSIQLHAEIDAIKNALRTVNVDDLRKYNLYICRVKQARRGMPFITGLSKPCQGCMRAIATFDIKNVFYTEDNAEDFVCL